MAEQDPDRYEVIVGNLGTVYSGPDRGEAFRRYRDYKSLSKRHEGRAADENVTIMRDGEPVLEYTSPENLWEGGAQSWLEHQINYVWNEEELRREFRNIATGHLDADTIQDIYQSEMADDGFFDGQEEVSDDEDGE